jgi:DNA helicase HerA-like ATPase
MLTDSVRAPGAGLQALGRIVSVNGSQASVALAADARHDARIGGDAAQVTVGKFLGITGGAGLIIGLVTEISEEVAADRQYRTVALLDLIGEIKNAAAAGGFQRGISQYPAIGDAAVLMSERDLRAIYGTADSNRGQIGDLQQNPNIGVNIDIDDLVSKHFAVLGATGTGKSSGVAIILQKILDARPNLRIFLVDPHNEYGTCFGDKAQVLTPRNLRLPFWFFNFEEIVDAFFGARPGVEEEVEILSEAIPEAKAMYLQYRSGAASERSLSKKRDARSTGFTADTPVPYRYEDLINVLDQRMGKLDARTSRVTIHRLIQRIQTFRNHPRYAFMFENANIGGDIMAETIGNLFRLPPNGKPMTIMQLAGFPAEVVDSVVSVLCRMAFDFGLWSDGAAPLLFVCEEAHRYAPADRKIGFGPTRRALSRIAKEGRKYGVFLGLVTQRPAEIDATIISQCSTLFVMRLANDRDQSLIRSAVSDAAANLLSFIPTLGTREVFAFGSGVALPTRLRFKEIPPERRPASESANTSRSEGANRIDQNFLGAVIDRWRSSTMSHKIADDDDIVPSLAEPPPTLQPAPVQQPSVQPAQAYVPPPRQSPLLKKPLEGASQYARPSQPAHGQPQQPHHPLPPGYPTRFR